VSYAFCGGVKGRGPARDADAQTELVNVAVPRLSGSRAGAADAKHGRAVIDGAAYGSVAALLRPIKKELERISASDKATMMPAGICDTGESRGPGNDVPPAPTLTCA
jgi:hypothetical protein